MEAKMNTLILSRIQFALTIGFHFIFPPLTIGLAWFIVWMMTKYKNTGDEHYRRMARFWIKLFAISFAVGVASGVPMEFQFGTNWSEYSRFVGDIFGVPLAIEVIFSFFLESVFIAVLLFGWGRVSARVHWFSALMVAFGSTLSAFWIIVANSWQQTPAGYHLVGGRAEVTNFWAAIFNPSTIPRFLHTVDGAIITGAFCMIGVSAWFILKARHTDIARESLKMALITAFIASVVQLGLGHYHAVQVTHTQPEKLAAIEGLFETQKRAPALVFGIPDEKAETMRIAIKIPGLLSLLTSGNVDAEVKGLKDFPKEEWPPLALTFYPFHLMVALGIYFIIFSAVGLFLLWKNKLFSTMLFMKIALWSIPLPFISNELGWISAEVGRQPWIVYHLLKTRDAASVTVPAGQVLFSIIMFCLIYSMLFGAWIFLLRRQLERGPENADNKQSSLGK
jgi:cytochrome d ubiquinol oxidase subunit I